MYVCMCMSARGKCMVCVYVCMFASAEGMVSRCVAQGHQTNEDSGEIPRLCTCSRVKKCPVTSSEDVSRFHTQQHRPRAPSTPA